MMPSRSIRLFIDQYPMAYFGFAIAFIAVLFLLHYLSKRKAPSYTYRDMMTPNELEFFQRLTEALPSYWVFPQVAMSALIQPTIAKTDQKYLAHFRKYSQKVVDYVICQRDTLEPVAVIELDDSTHNKEKDRVRDEMLRQAGFRTIRWQSKNKPNITEIRQRIGAF